MYTPDGSALSIIVIGKESRKGEFTSKFQFIFGLQIWFGFIAYQPL